MTARVPKSLVRIAERCASGQVLCHGLHGDAWWWEPGGDQCSSAKARRAVRLGIVRPLSVDLFGDDRGAQTFGASA